jgi:hypothetical protein
VGRWEKNWLCGPGEHWGWVLVGEPKNVASGALGGRGWSNWVWLTRVGLVND